MVNITYDNFNLAFFLCLSFKYITRLLFKLDRRQRKSIQNMIDRAAFCSGAPMPVCMMINVQIQIDLSWKCPYRGKNSTAEASFIRTFSHQVPHKKKPKKKTRMRMRGLLVFMKLRKPNRCTEVQHKRSGSLISFNSFSHNICGPRLKCIIRICNRQ